MEKSKQEKFRAAYALNLCSVSVSQIIDYNDINILEQEYDAILNNLNLQEMPKDESFLDILKHLLDTITFFRIQEGEKKFVDQDYQKKMKDVIWKAIPSPNVIFASADPKVMAMALATQVGIGYMNYRRAKAENQDEYAKAKWKLHASALEQFNGLQRDLFTTAWRIADEYDFDDKLRLTENQIKQFNAILMDNNLIRKYERLESIQEQYEAYPPFWYQIGSAANKISYEYKDDDPFGIVELYKNKAIKYFEKFEENYVPLLREDQIAASCLLEHVDLLDAEKDKAKIVELLEQAEKFAGKEQDVLQIISLDYQKIGELSKAETIFRKLVNEDYNRKLNAQLLSRIYVQNYIEDNNRAEYGTRYKLLADRLSTVQNLFQLPEPKETYTEEDKKAISDKFFVAQKESLERKIEPYIDNFVRMYGAEFNKLIPVPDYEKEYFESYFELSNLSARKNDFLSSIKWFRGTDGYQNRICAIDYDTDIKKIAVEMMNSIRDNLRDYVNFEECSKIMLTSYNKNRELLDNFDKRLNGEKPEDFKKTVIEFYNFMNSIIPEALVEKIKSDLIEDIKLCDTMEEVSSLESALRSWTKDMPLVEVSGEEEITAAEKIQTILEKLEAVAAGITTNPDKLRLLIKYKGPAFTRYIDKCQSGKKLGKSMLGILQNTSLIDRTDIIFTCDKIVVLRNGYIAETTTYGNVKLADSSSLFIGRYKYSNKNCNISELNKLVEEINSL